MSGLFQSNNTAPARRMIDQARKRNSPSRPFTGMDANTATAGGEAGGMQPRGGVKGRANDIDARKQPARGPRRTTRMGGMRSTLSTR
jgi:hypothetical protein